MLSNARYKIVMNFGKKVDFVEYLTDILKFNLKSIFALIIFILNTSIMDSSGAGIAICLGVSLALCFCLPFIICDLYFAYNDSSPCLTEDLHAVSFTLKTWLEVDAYVKIVSLVLIIILLVLAITKSDAVGAFGGCFMIYSCLISLFNLAWFIVGAIIFWGQLNPNGTCHSSLNSYMWALLILNAIGIFCQLTSGRQQQQQ